MLKKNLKNLIVASFWIAVWEIASLSVGNELLLPAPLTVFLRLCELAVTGGFYATVGMSLLRVCSGIAVSFILGVAAAVVTERFKTARAVITPFISVIKSTPVASFIMLALLWLDRGILPAFIAVLIALPVVWANVCAGIRSIDRGLLQVTSVYRFSFSRRLSLLYIPSVYPHFMSACRSSVGLAWKAGIAAEVLAVPALSIGKMIYGSKLYLETVDLFAWSTAVIILSVIIESVLCAWLFGAGKRYERQGTANEA